ncbi:MAG TPA: putative toxin-antitoxin system toxin component, PIN family [Phycisphaerae bacterium]|nr:putative toxin-antitoxin system toxin component, PIN family [Phycisphaerae bacterium]
MQPQIVLDTNVLLSGLHSRLGASFALLNKISAGDVGIHLSVPLLLQYQDVLVRNVGKLEVDEATISAAIDRLCAVGTYHQIYYLWRPLLPDPKDDLILELAVAAKCTHIVTHNIRDFRCTDSFGIAVVSPIQLLKDLGDRP